MRKLSLQTQLQDLGDAIHEWHRTNSQTRPAILGRILATFDEEPLRGLLLASLPPVDFPSWWQSCLSSMGGLAGSGTFLWPSGSASRVATQLALLRAMHQEAPPLHEVAYCFCYDAASRHDGGEGNLGRLVLEPLLRDLTRLVERTDLSPALTPLLAAPFLSTQDGTLDQLLLQAISGIQSKSPLDQQQALEKLWDAWERLKSLEDPTDKRRSVLALFQRLPYSEPVRQILESEARCLTDIGNAFHIRHFEVGKDAIPDPAFGAYLFVRLWTLIQIIVHHRHTSCARPA